nr:reverse transcriptase domain-containing protein [Tanacetum cinerariifolium]
MARECLAIIESKSKVRYSCNKPIVPKVSTNTSTSGISHDVTELKDMVKALLLDKKSQNQAPATLKAVEESFSKSPILTSKPVNSPTIEPVAFPISAPRPNLRPSIPYPSRFQDQKFRDKANDQREKIFQIFKDLNFNISFVDALILMPKFGSSIKSLLTNKDKLCELARTPLNEHCSAVLLKKLPEKMGDPGKFLIPCDFPEKAECLALANLGASINLMPLSVWNKPSLPDLSPTCMTLKLTDRLISRLVGVAEDVYVKVEVDAFLALEDGPTSPKFDQSYLDPEEDILLLEAFMSDDPSLPPPNQGNYLPEVRKELKICKAKSDKSSTDEPPEVELKDLPPHLEYAFLEGVDKLPVIIAKDLSMEEKTTLTTVLKSHKRAIAWKLSDIKGIDPEFCTHKILMEEEFEPAVQHQRRVNPKIYDVIKQEVLKLLDVGLIYPIFDSLWVSPVHCVPKKGCFTVVENKDNELILTRLVTGENHIHCPYGTFAYRRMPFGLCNAPGTFQRCMMAIFYDVIKKTMEVFMDDFSEKSHFMVKEGIVLGHKISKQEIEVDKAKIDVITKLPHPTTVKGIRSFLGHAGFYRRFIKDFSKIARPMTRLLEKDTPFIFSKECVEAFQTLKRNLTEAPILIAPDWDIPFELMCDASDFAVGAVLGQRQDKNFRPIHYASKTMTEAESNYTTTKKEMLAIGYAFETFWSYLILNKSIVYTDHSALKYLFAKKDSKARLLHWVLLL